MEDTKRINKKQETKLIRKNKKIYQTIKTYLYKLIILKINGETRTFSSNTNKLKKYLYNFNMTFGYIPPIVMLNE